MKHPDDLRTQAEAHAWGDALLDSALAGGYIDADGRTCWPMPDGRVWTARAFTDAEGLYQVPEAPGFYRDLEGGIHINVPEMLTIVNLEDTPENRAAILEMAESALGPGKTLVRRGI